MSFRYYTELASKFFIRIYEDKKLILISIFVISVLASLFFLIFLRDIGPLEHKIPGTDYLYYYAPVADSISEGQGIPVKEYIGTRYPIGYPFILSVLFSTSDLLDIERLKLIVIFNVLVTALATCFLFLFVKSIFNKKIALISAFLWLSYPFNLWFIKNPNTEVPFILLFYLALWMYVLGIQKHSFKLFLVSGALIGFMSLIRPISIFLPTLFVIFIFFLVKKSQLAQKILLSSLLLAAYIIVISPWIIYVYLNIGKVIPLSAGGPPSISAGLTMMISEAEERGKVILPPDVINLINKSKNRNMESFENIASFSIQELINQPIVFLKLIGIKMTRAWYATSATWWEKQILLIQLIYLIPGLVGIILWFKKFKNKILYFIFLLTIIFYFWAVTVAALSILRYMIPVMAIWMIFVAITVNTILDKLKNININEA